MLGTSCSDPLSEFVRYGLGSVEFKAGKNQAAIKCFKAASNLNPTNSIILCCIGNVGSPGINRL